MKPHDLLASWLSHFEKPVIAAGKLFDKDMEAASLALAIDAAGFAIVPKEPTEDMQLKGLVGLVVEIEKMCGPLPKLPAPDADGNVEVPARDLAQRYMAIGAVMRTGREIIACWRAMVAAAA